MNSTTLLKLPQYCKYWAICIGNITVSINKKNVNEIPEIEVFLGHNLNFTVRVSTWDLANDDDINKKEYFAQFYQ